jgi:hypothetical protein
MVAFVSVISSAGVNTVPGVYDHLIVQRKRVRYARGIVYRHCAISLVKGRDSSRYFLKRARAQILDCDGSAVVTETVVIDHDRIPDPMKLAGTDCVGPEIVIESEVHFQIGRYFEMCVRSAIDRYVHRLCGIVNYFDGAANGVYCHLS